MCLSDKNVQRSHNLGISLLYHNLKVHIFAPLFAKTPKALNYKQYQNERTESDWLSHL